MPGLPEINVPSVQGEAAPVNSDPIPPLGAFAGAHVGAGLEEVGKELFKVGYGEYRRAAEAHAQEKETEFQTKALKLRDDYKNLYNGDAVAGHQKYTADLEKLRSSIRDTIPSKYGANLYNNSSLRNIRFVQESMDAHFEQQNRGYQALQFKKANVETVKTVAKFATDDSYPAANIEATIQARFDENVKHGLANGMDAETAENFAKGEAVKATDALFSQLMDKKSKHPSELIKQELGKYSEKGWVSPTKLKDTSDAISGKETNEWVSRTMANFVRKDFLGNVDPEGHISKADLMKAVGDLPADDRFREDKIAKLEAEWKRRDTAYWQTGAEHENTVMAKSAVGDDSSLDWQRFKRLYPVRAAEMDYKHQSRAYTQDRREHVSQRDASRESYGSVRLYIDQLSKEDAENMTPATVQQMMRQNYHGPGIEPDPGEASKALEFLKKAKEGKLDPIERKFNQIASQSLEEAYKGDKSKVRAMMNRAHYFLDDAYGESIKKGKPLGELELRQKLAQEFTRKGGFLGIGAERAGEKYEPAPRTKEVPAGRYTNPNTGKPGRWDGKAWVE